LFLCRSQRLSALQQVLARACGRIPDMIEGHSNSNGKQQRNPFLNFSSMFDALMDAKDAGRSVRCMIAAIRSVLKPLCSS
jgi:hypothetical protein